MGNWHSVNIIRLADYINGFGFKPVHWTKDGLPIVRIEQLKNPDSKYDYCSIQIPENNIIDNGDLIFSWSASLFLKIWDREKAALNQHLFKVIPNEQTDKLFLKYLLEYNLEELTKAAHGSTMQHITRKELAQFKAYIPKEKFEQTRIAEKLSIADEAIAHTEALIAKYQRIKTGLMQDLLTCGIDENGTIRSKATHKFVVKNGIEVPEEWEVEQIENHCIHSAFGPRFPGNLYSISGNIGTLRTTDLDTEGNINYKTIPFANLNIKDFESHLLIDDDLLITRSGTVGVVSVFKKQTFHVIPAAFLIRFRLKNSILPEFLRFYFRNEIGKRKLLDIAEGGVQKNIRGSSILKLFVPIPSPVEQKEINKRLSQIENLIQDHDILLSKLQSLKTGFMQDLLSGKVRVKIDKELETNN